MTPIEFAAKYDIEVAVLGNGDTRKIKGGYCGDLLSMVMGRAQEDNAFSTVMANINTIAVAVLADVSCIILCEGMHFDKPSLLKAREQEVCVLETKETSFSIAVKLGKELGLC